MRSSCTEYRQVEQPGRSCCNSSAAKLEWHRGSGPNAGRSRTPANGGGEGSAYVFPRIPARDQWPCATDYSPETRHRVVGPLYAVVAEYAGDHTRSGEVGATAIDLCGHQLACKYRRRGRSIKQGGRRTAFLATEHAGQGFDPYSAGLSSKRLSLRCLSGGHTYP